MALEGWHVVYAKRPGPHADGSGIFYRSERFRVLRSLVINFNDLVPQDEGTDSAYTTPAYRAEEEHHEQQGKHRLESPRMEHYHGSGHPIHVLDDHHLCNENSHADHQEDVTREDDSADQQQQQQQQEEGQQQGQEHHDHHRHQQLQQHQKHHQPPDMSDPQIRFKRDCVAVVAAFQEVNPSDSSNSPETPGGSSAQGASDGGRIVIVVSSHIYWNPNCPDVKLAQAQYLLQEVARFRSDIDTLYDHHHHGTSWPSADIQLRGGEFHEDDSRIEGKKEQIHIPVVICGDFNSKPGDPVYRYLLSGSTNDESHEEDCRSGGEGYAGGCSTANDAPIPLASLNAVAAKERSMCHTAFTSPTDWDDLPQNLEPAFTSFTAEFKATVDYIFVSRDSGGFFVHSTLWIPNDSDSHLAGGLPNLFFPSDHLPIGGDVVFDT
ncbi:unnamed protein product [Closterium sp. NIES-54]